MAVQATATTMQIIADSLFDGDAGLYQRYGNGAYRGRHIEAFSGRRVQALLGLPAFRPDHPKARAGQREQFILRATLVPKWSATVSARVSGRLFLGQVHCRARASGSTRRRRRNWRSTTPPLSTSPDMRRRPTRWPGRCSCLSKQPALQKRWRPSAVRLRRLGDRSLPDRLPRLRQMLEETLRLYPPAPRIDRQAVAADRLASRR